jgi:hypothetical protein
MHFASDLPRWTVSDEQDEMIERIAAQLRPLPEIDPAARARVLIAVAAERERGRAHAERRWPRVARWMEGGALVAAVALGAFFFGRERAGVPRASTATAGHVGDSVAGVDGVRLASRGSEDAASLRPVQLVFRAPNARRVSVVGDFTGWDPQKVVMTRDSGSGLWSVALALTPGRHVYAFLVDDSLWTRDPRAPAAPDADFGRPGSVLLVGRP